MDKKQKAAAISVISNISLMVTKLFVGFFTNSISIISEAAHSFMDFLAALIALYSVKKSAEPADEKHQFGHGKFEDASGVAEGVLILVAAALIVHESFDKLLTGRIDYIDSFAGIAVMGLSVVVNILVSRNLYKVAKETDSMALFADAEHLRTDVLTSAGVLAGLILIKFTGLKILDPIVAILVSFLIIKAGIDLCISSMRNLLDVSLPKEDMAKIKEVLDKYLGEKIISYNNLKTRKSGGQKLIEFSLVIQGELMLKDVYTISRDIEDDLRANIHNASVLIQAEPFMGD